MPASSDEAILEAWGGARGVSRQYLATVAEQIREAVEMAGEQPATVWYGEFCTSIDVASVRANLGGWDAVWKAVLADEGFEPLRGVDGWELGMPHAGLVVRVGPEGRELWIAGLKDCVPLRSPADLRRRVAAARGLFGEDN